MLECAKFGWTLSIFNQIWCLSAQITQQGMYSRALYTEGLGGSSENSCMSRGNWSFGGSWFQRVGPFDEKITKDWVPDWRNLDVAHF
jgi:hypothetical protein